MQPRQHHFSGLATERDYGYSRAVRVGDRVYVAGCTALEAGRVVPAFKDDAYAQSKEAFRRIEAALTALGSSLKHVIAVRGFVTDRKHIPGFIRAHAETFADVLPASTMVGTPFLVHPDLLVEIEVEAVD